MNTRQILRHGSRLAPMLAGLAIGMPAAAAQLSLGNLPLFLGTTSEPNIFFIIDDSGSMDWEVMTQDYANGGRFTGTQPDGTSPASAGGVTHRDSDEDAVAECTFASASFNGYLYGVEFASNSYGDDGNDCNTADEQSWRFRNSDFNPLYFDPTAAYVPWAGVDADGNPFGDIDVTDAPDNPYLTAAAQRRIDLTQHSSNWGGSFNNRRTADRDGDGVPDGFRYYTWNDTDGDGLFDDGEETEFLVKDQSAAMQQNFANWFSYYRSRELVAKAAYGQLIAQSNNVRMGLVTLHNNNAVNIEIEEMNSDAASGNKKDILDSLYAVQSNSGTPLRTNLDMAGRYLECTSGGHFGTCPALSAADGGMCQQNFAVLMTDGFYNGGFSGVDNADGDANTSFDGGAYADTLDDTLGDIAMHYYERDLQGTIGNSVPVISGVDEANHQHMVTYGVAFGVVGSVSDMPGDPTTAFTWPDPFSGTTAQQNSARIDDLRHAAYNGRGQFMSAQSPQALVDSLTEALADIGDRTGSAAAVALNSGSLNTDTTLFQARFDTSDWSGHLLALGIDSNGDVGTFDWDAAAELNAQDWNTGRAILTTSADTRAGVPFRWDQIGAAQRDALGDDPTTPAADDDGEGESRLAYLRGDRTNEGAGNFYRERSSVLGDIVHSAPFFVGAPSYNYSDTLESDPYSTFAETHENRTEVVYVGANDGMLHGFDADTGVELIAYVPEVVFDELGELSDMGYIHRFYVDGLSTAGDAHINGAWRTVVAGALRNGGQGLFALDVTSPSSFSEANAANIVLWEFTDADDADLGYVFGQVSIVRMANGKWAMVFGNGYNSSEADGAASTTGHAALFIVFIEDGDDGAWSVGDYVKLDTGQGSVATPNGLSTATPIDINGDSIVDYIYAGDLEGNMWKFDVTASDENQWEAAWTTGSDNDPKPLFTACESSPCTATNRQPITTRPQVTFHPEGEPGYMLYFGTGKYIETTDNSAGGELTQTFYGIWDKAEYAHTSFTRAHLLEQEIIEELVEWFDTTGDGAADTRYDLRLSSDEPILWHTSGGLPSGAPITTHLGWALDLYNTQLGTNTNNLGERQVSDSIVRNGRIVFTTLLPSTDPCDFGGDGWLMELDLINGGQYKEPVFDLNLDSRFNELDEVQASYDANGDGTVDGDDMVPPTGKKSKVGIIPKPAVLSAGEVEYKYTSGSTGGIGKTVENPGPGQTGRQSWRQLR